MNTAREAVTRPSGPASRIQWRPGRLGFFVAFLGGPLLTFLPVITRDVFHRDVGFYTQLMTFSGAGALMGALFAAWLGENKLMGRILLIMLAMFRTIIVGFGFSQRTCLSALMLFSGGLLFVMCSSLTTSLAQLLAPPEFRGRVVSIFSLSTTVLGGRELQFAFVLKIRSCP
jgi:MFS family permease